MIEKKEKPVIIAICGKSATGKDTLKKELFKSLFINDNVFVNSLILDTTRPKRTNEKDGADYFFINERKFHWKRKKLLYLNWTKFKKWYYGLPASRVKIDCINIGVFSIYDLISLLKKKDSYIIIPVYINESWKIRLKRSCDREKEIKFEYFRRLYKDHQDFKGVGLLLEMFDYSIDLKDIHEVEDRVSYIKDSLKNMGILQ